MKLKAREPELPSSKLVLDVPGKLRVSLEDYGRYYESSHGHTLALELVAVDMLSAFIASDYEFSKWRRERAGKTSRRSPKSSRVSPHVPAGAERGEGR